MPENKVKLVIDNKINEGWESVSIVCDLNSIARAFQLGITFDKPNGFSLWDYKVGKPVQLCIDDELILTGYIDQTPVMYDAHQRTVTIVGRSKTADLIDCCPYPSDEEIAKISTRNKWWKYGIHPSGTVVSPAQKTARNWHNEQIEKIIATLIAPYDIRLISQVNSQEKKNNFSITPTDKIIDSIRNLVKNRDLLFTDDENGDLVIVKKQETATVNTPSLVLGENILKASIPFDGTKLYSHYGVVGQDKGSNSSYGLNVCKSNNVVPGDNLVADRARYIYEKAKGQSNSKTCEKEASGNKHFANNQFYKSTYTVQGWRNVFGELWKVNTIVSVKDDFLDKTGSMPFLIQKVTFSLTNESGMTTELEVVPPDGYRPPESTAKENTQKNTNINTSKTTASIQVNKNQYQTKYWS